MFIVHGRDEAMRKEAQATLNRFGIEGIVLHEEINEGHTIIEKFDREARACGYAVVLFSPDDMGGLRVGKAAPKLSPCARQNVVLELGYFVALLGRKNVFVLVAGAGLEQPSDFHGVVYVNNYVPFYLGPRSPMLYRISRHQPQAEIIYLLSQVQHIQQLGLPYVFTDGHAFEAITSFHQSSADLANLAWADIYAEQWKPTLENPNLQRHKQAEFLVHQFVPVNALVGIAVYNAHIRTQA